MLPLCATKRSGLEPNRSRAGLGHSPFILYAGKRPE